MRITTISLLTCFLSATYGQHIRVSSGSPRTYVTPGAPRIKVNAASLGDQVSLRSSSITTHRSYVSWQEKPEAMFYLAERSYTGTFNDAYRVFEGGGLDFFDPTVVPGQTVHYRIKAYNPVTNYESSWRYVELATPAAAAYTSTAVGDMDSVVVTFNASAMTATKSAGSFAAGDVGKIISIRNARKPTWYSRGSYFYNGIITAVNAGVATIAAPVSGGKRMGDPATEAANVTDTAWFGTNNYTRIAADIAYCKANGKNLLVFPTGYCMIDPYRDTTWMTTNHFTTNGIRGHYIENFDLTIKNAKLKYAYEDFIYQSDDPTNFFAYNKAWSFSAWTAKNSTLKMDSCTIIGVKNENRYIERSNGRFFSGRSGDGLDINSRIELYFTNGEIKGGSSAWTTGFSSGFDIAASNPTWKSTIHFQNATLRNAEFGGGGVATSVFSDTFGIRLTYRNVKHYGSGIPTHNKPVLATVNNGVLMVDSTTYPYYTNYIVRLEATNYVGGTYYYRTDKNRMHYMLIGNGGIGYKVLHNTVLDNYRSNIGGGLTNGTYYILAYYAGNGDGGQDRDGTLNGHANYVNTNVETYIDSVYYAGFTSLYLRRNNADAWSGNHQQATFQNVSSNINDGYLYAYLDTFRVKCPYPDAPLTELGIYANNQGFDLTKQALFRNSTYWCYIAYESLPAYIENCTMSGSIGSEYGTTYVKNSSSNGYGNVTAPGLTYVSNTFDHKMKFDLRFRTRLNIDGGYVGFSMASMVPYAGNCEAFTTADSCLVNVSNARFPKWTFQFSGGADTCENNYYLSQSGATSSGDVVTVTTTALLKVGFGVVVKSGTGQFQAGSYVTEIISGTQFRVSQVPATALSGGATVVEASGVPKTIGIVPYFALQRYRITVTNSQWVTENCWGTSYCGRKYVIDAAVDLNKWNQQITPGFEYIMAEN